MKFNDTFDTRITALLEEYEEYLYLEEKSSHTIQKYLRDLRAFFIHLNDKSLSKDAVLCWKKDLTDRYAPASVNSMLAALNHYLAWTNRPECRVKPLKIQKSAFCQPDKELSQSEYIQLVRTAEQEQNPRLSLLLQTLCSTGIRISELRYITVSSVQAGRTLVNCKGKQRIIFLPKSLCRALQRYCKEQHIRDGSVFCSRTGRPLDRSNVWKAMKVLCLHAGIAAAKVFPHNLRHLFARTYYSREKDLARLADLMGHASVNTTRIYIIESGIEHARQLESMGLVIDRLLKKPDGRHRNTSLSFS